MCPNFEVYTIEALEHRFDPRDVGEKVTVLVRLTSKEHVGHINLLKPINNQKTSNFLQSSGFEIIPGVRKVFENNYTYVTFVHSKSAKKSNGVVTIPAGLFVGRAEKVQNSIPLLDMELGDTACDIKISSEEVFVILQPSKPDQINKYKHVKAHIPRLSSDQTQFNTHPAVLVTINNEAYPTLESREDRVTVQDGGRISLFLRTSGASDLVIRPGNIVGAATSIISQHWINTNHATTQDGEEVETSASKPTTEGPKIKKDQEHISTLTFIYFDSKILDSQKRFCDILCKEKEICDIHDNGKQFLEIACYFRPGKSFHALINADHQNNACDTSLTTEHEALRNLKQYFEDLQKGRRLFLFTNSQASFALLYEKMGPEILERCFYGTLDAKSWLCGRTKIGKLCLNKYGDICIKTLYSKLFHSKEQPSSCRETSEYLFRIMKKIKKKKGEHFKVEYNILSKIEECCKNKQIKYVSRDENSSSKVMSTTKQTESTKNDSLLPLYVAESFQHTAGPKGLEEKITVVAHCPCVEKLKYVHTFPLSHSSSTLSDYKKMKVTPGVKKVFDDNLVYVTLIAPKFSRKRKVTFSQGEHFAFAQPIELCGNTSIYTAPELNTNSASELLVSNIVPLYTLNPSEIVFVKAVIKNFFSGSFSYPIVHVHIHCENFPNLKLHEGKENRFTVQDNGEIFLPLKNEGDTIIFLESDTLIGTVTLFLHNKHKKDKEKYVVYLDCEVLVDGMNKQITQIGCYSKVGALEKSLFLSVVPGKMEEYKRYKQSANLLTLLNLNYDEKLHQYTFTDQEEVFRSLDHQNKAMKILVTFLKTNSMDCDLILVLNSLEILELIKSKMNNNHETSLFFNQVLFGVLETKDLLGVAEAVDVEDLYQTTFGKSWGKENPTSKDIAKYMHDICLKKNPNTSEWFVKNQTEMVRFREKIGGPTPGKEKSQRLCSSYLTKSLEIMKYSRPSLPVSIKCTFIPQIDLTDNQWDQTQPTLPTQFRRKESWIEKAKKDLYWKCHSCLSLFYNSKSFKKHKKKLHNKKCNSAGCENTFVLKDDLLLHKRVVHHKQINHWCKICDQPYNKHNKHRAVHNFDCPVAGCSIATISKEELRRHLINKHEYGTLVNEPVK